MSQTDNNEKKNHGAPAQKAALRRFSSWRQKLSRSKHKRLITRILFASVVFILVAGSWVVYVLWYQNPNKVVADAMVNAITAQSFTAKGRMTQTGDRINSKFVFDGKWGYRQGGDGTFKFTLDRAIGNDVDIDGKVIRSAGGNNYMKINNFNQIFGYLLDVYTSSPERSSHAPAIRSAYNSYFLPGIKNIENKWIKLDIADLDGMNNTHVTAFACLSQEMIGFAKNRDMLKELADKYEQYKFIIIEKSLKSQSGNFGYIIRLDKTLTKKFTQSLKSTRLYNNLQECSKSGENSLSLIGSVLEGFAKADIRGEVWIDSWSHHLESLKLHSSTSKEADKKGTVFEVTTTFNTPAGDVDSPKDYTSVPFKDIIGSLFQYTVSAGSQVPVGEKNS